jgi:NADP-dependent alcohol dehydrogenase
MKAVAIVKNKIDFILAVGGGSVIDGVKFISGAVNYGNQSRFYKTLFNKENSNPLEQLTLPATGSEMNSGAVVTIRSTKKN